VPTRGWDTPGRPGSKQPTDFVGTGYNLSGVVKMVTYIDIDWRYGFDGQTSPTQPYGEDSGSGRFVNSLLSLYPQGSSAFCQMLSQATSTPKCTS
jgi:hypothetical protein